MVAAFQLERATLGGNDRERDPQTMIEIDPQSKRGHRECPRPTMICVNYASCTPAHESCRHFCHHSQQRRNRTTDARLHHNDHHLQVLRCLTPKISTSCCSLIHNLRSHGSTIQFRASRDNSHACADASRLPPTPQRPRLTRQQDREESSLRRAECLTNDAGVDSLAARMGLKTMGGRVLCGAR